MLKLFNGGQTSENQTGSDLDPNEGVAAVPNQTDWWFLLFLLQYEALHGPGENHQ